MFNSPEPAIRFDRVSKRFQFRKEKPHSVLESFISLFRRHNKEDDREFWALKEISFDVSPGQTLGIIGRNGSGKSTVLKLVARIIRPTAGEVSVRGRVSALLELGAGFHPDLTGRENIALNASVLGLTQADVEEKFDDIVAFSELDEFIDMPVKHYSSGMYMRLGFSVAIHVDPDILIVDEILAVGDQAFQRKCVDRIHDLKHRGVTIIMVSHNMEVMRRLCSHLIWIEDGTLRSSGPTESVAAQYGEFSQQAIDQQSEIETEAGKFRRWGNREIEITGLRFLDQAGEEKDGFQTGDAVVIEMSFAAHKPILDPEFGLAIFRRDGVQVNGPNIGQSDVEIGIVDGEGVVRYCMPSTPLLPAKYEVTAAIHDSRMPLAYDFHERAYHFRIEPGGSREVDGLVEVPSTWEYEPQSLGVLEMEN